MEKMGISRNGTIDRERTEELKLARDDDIVDDCAREARGFIIFFKKLYE